METEKPVMIPNFGDVCIRRLRRKRQRKLLVSLFLDFAKNTTLHGLRYITEKGLHIVEKTFWFITFFASAAVCFFFIFNVWEKWQRSPVIVSFNAKRVSVDEVPFPSVTVCPHTQFLQENFNYTEVWKLGYDAENTTEYKMNHTEDISTASVLSLVCDVTQALDYSMDEGNLNSSVIEHIQNILVDYDTVFDGCYFRGRRCDWKISKVLTKSGVCFNFNGLRAEDILSDNVQKDFNYTSASTDIKNWTMDRGYLTKNRDVFPVRGIDNGLPNLLLFLENLEEKKDKRCNALEAGYKIYLHHPADFPQALLYHFAALPKQSTSMGVKFTMETANPDLKKYPADIRQCYFPEDRPLRFFKIYTYNNCMLECLTNFTFKECKCVMVYMPYNDSTKICSATKTVSCYETIESKFENDINDCKCLPPCDFISYDAEIHKSDFFIGAALDAHNWGEKIDDNGKYNPESDTQSRVEVFFKQAMFRTVHRSELYGLTDFLGNCGGLLGLFLGFSCLSLVEIFYFLTFRVFKTIKTDLKHEKDEKSKQDLQAKNE